MAETTDARIDEQAEREEMFGFHPEILAEAAELPRRSDGRGYSDPDTRMARANGAAPDV